MEEADVKPDSATFSYLISSSNCEEDIIKVLLELCLAKIIMSWKRHYCFTKICKGHELCQRQSEGHFEFGSPAMSLDI